MAVKISDNVGTDETEPEILFNPQQHAREHLTVEMAIYLLNLFTDSYGTDSRITNIVNSREIWIVPDRQPRRQRVRHRHRLLPVLAQEPAAQRGSSNVGTDLNRNWGYNWGCCGGSSGTTSSETYRGPAAFSAPETAGAAQLRQQPGGRRRAADQGEHRLPHVLAAGALALRLHHREHRARADADQYDTFATIGQQMAATNSYTPEQSSDLYITDGDSLDWMWATHKIFAYTFEMYPSSAGGGGFYPPDEVIPAQTSPQPGGGAAPPASTPTARTGPSASRRSTAAAVAARRSTPTPSRPPPAGPSTRPAPTPPPLGAWERGDPAATTSSGAKQLGTTVSRHQRPGHRPAGRHGGRRLRRRRRRDQRPLTGDHPAGQRHAEPVAVLVPGARLQRLVSATTCG